MPKRPFLVLPDGFCIPLEGAYRIEQIHSEWYVLGHNDAIACESEAASRLRLESLMVEHDAHALAAEALEGLPDGYQVVAQQR